MAGSDSRGTAYGLLEISRLAGVSPWEWWADVTPDKRGFFVLPDKAIIQAPSVQYRGIFLNDEDFGLNPWSTKNFEPNAKTLYPLTGYFKGGIGPKTYGRIFELLLRLRANAIWPAMHEVTMPFYFVEGNRQMAEKYGIYIGSAHCEPLARNSATEWDLAGKGEYNYITNKENVVSYWEARLKELKNSNNIFTVGMRGKHDGAMQGVKSIEEYKEAITQVMADQSTLLKKYINPDITQIPQMLIPYKEVLDVYEAGLKVPDYVTLMWCDDNYGYITHFPNAEEQKRSGGNGVYYHLSYWGRPHDYLWLGTASPALLYHQMKLAYEKDSRKIWIVNVGDIKPIEYQTALFLDMAWDMNAAAKPGYLQNHMLVWLQSTFGREMGQTLLPLMEEHYRLAYIRKPEFLGNTRTEEKDPKYTVVTDLPWSDEEIKTRLGSYRELSETVGKLETQVPAAKKDAYFELVQYPIQAAALMNNKMLYGQLARHNKATWEQSDAAYDSIAMLTDKYSALNNGKWNLMMDYKPHKLPVFDKLKREAAVQEALVNKRPLQVINGAGYSGSTVKPKTIDGLGYAGRAVALEKGSSITYQLDNNIPADSVVVAVHLLPNHAPDGKQLRFSIEMNGKAIREVSYKTQGRSEEWKENVMRNQAVREFTFPAGKNAENRVVITALDEGVVIDEIRIYIK